MSMLNNIIITFYYKPFSESFQCWVFPFTGRSEILNAERMKLGTKLERLVVCSLLHSQETLAWGEAGEDLS